VIVKGRYSRPLHGVADEGGRVTELVARPLLARLFPSLAWLSQPLAGEVALRRSALVGVELGTGYGVEVAMLVDVARRHGPEAIAESDLGVRAHRNRPTRELAAQADEVLCVLFEKAGLTLPDPSSGATWHTRAGAR
jgi:glucosyl-3-phosphoglycerate synthase